MSNEKQKKRTKKKSTNSVFKKRVLELMPLVSFLSRAEIIQYVTDSTDWNVTERQIDNYIKATRENLKKTSEERMQSIRADAYNNYVNLYKKSFMIEDYRTCLSIQARIDTIFGLDKVDVKKTDTTQNLTINVNTAEVNKNIEELENL